MQTALNFTGIPFKHLMINKSETNVLPLKTYDTHPPPFLISEVFPDNVQNIENVLITIMCHLYYNLKGNKKNSDCMTRMPVRYLVWY